MKALAKISVATLIVCHSATIAVATTYSITDLGTFGGTRSLAWGINSSGQVTGSALDSSGNWRAFLYSDGAIKDLGTLGGLTSGAYALNDNGQVVGYADTASGQEHTFVYSNGVMTDLGTLGGPNSFAKGINNTGQIVGSSYTSPTAPYLPQAFLYSNRVMSAIGTEFATEADAINATGQVVGYLSFGFTYHAFLYSGGNMIDLGTLPGQSSSGALAINTLGEVAGWTNSYPFLYSHGVMTNLGMLPGDDNFYFAEADGLNDIGQVVGKSAGSFGGPERLRAFLYDGGVMTDLNSLLVPGSGWKLEDADAINDNGQITGYGINPSGEEHGFLLSPALVTPEPPGLVLTALGAFVLIFNSWGARPIPTPSSRPRQPFGNRRRAATVTVAFGQSAELRPADRHDCFVVRQKRATLDRIARKLARSHDDGSGTKSQPIESNSIRSTCDNGYSWSGPTPKWSKASNP